MTDEHRLVAIREELDREWLEEGFLHKLREREFDDAGFVRLEKLLLRAQDADAAGSQMIDREFVRLLWFVPQFFDWQVERLIENGADAERVHAATSSIRELVGTILGEP